MDRLNQWLTLFANIGVLVGIAFLAYEIRQNSGAIQSQTRATIFSGGQEELWKTMEYPDVTVNMGLGNKEMSIEEKIRLDAWLTAAMRAREFAWLEFENGNLDPDQYAGDQEVIRMILGSPRTKRWWKEIARPSFPKQFAEMVDELIADSQNHDYFEKVLSIE